MTRRHYINNATPTTFTGSLTSGATSGSLSDLSSYPASFPYTAVINAGEADAEVVLVNAVAGNAITDMTRGYDGTAAQAHANGATFSHVAVKADYDEANDHINLTAGVHGIAGSVVGTSDAQELTNKTLTNPVINGVSGDLTASGDLSGVNGTLSGDLSANDASLSGNLTVTGDVTISGAATVGGAAVLTVDDSGVVTAGVTALNSCTVSAQNLRRYGKVVQFNLTIVLSNNANLNSAGASGNLTNLDVATLPAGYRPVFDCPASPMGTGPLCSYVISAAGVVTIAATVPDIDLRGDTVTLGGTFLIP